jgi:hypothetical protein
MKRELAYRRVCNLQCASGAEGYQLLILAEHTLHAADFNLRQAEEAKKTEAAKEWEEEEWEEEEWEEEEWEDEDAEEKKWKENKCQTCAAFRHYTIFGNLPSERFGKKYRGFRNHMFGCKYAETHRVPRSWRVCASFREIYDVNGLPIQCGTNPEKINDDCASNSSFDSTGAEDHY